MLTYFPSLLLGLQRGVSGILGRIGDVVAWAPLTWADLTTLLLIAYIQQNHPRCLPRLRAKASALAAS